MKPEDSGRAVTLTGLDCKGRGQGRCWPRGRFSLQLRPPPPPPGSGSQEQRPSSSVSGLPVASDGSSWALRLPMLTGHFEEEAVCVPSIEPNAPLSPAVGLEDSGPPFPRSPSQARALRPGNIAPVMLMPAVGADPTLWAEAQDQASELRPCQLGPQGPPRHRLVVMPNC